MVELPRPFSDFPIDPLLVISSKAGAALSCLQVLEAIYVELRNTVTDYKGKLGQAQRQMVDACFQSRLNLYAPQIRFHEKERDYRRIDLHGPNTEFGGLQITSRGCYRLRLVPRTR